MDKTNEIIHLTYADLVRNAQEIGACTALARMLDEGIKNQISGSGSAYTLDNLHDFVVELRQRLNRIKV